MGCGQSNSNSAQQPLSVNVNNKTVPAINMIKKVDLTKYQTILLGVSKHGPLVLALRSNFKIQKIKTKYNFPRYSQALISLNHTNIAYLTGGVEQLQINTNQKASIQMQILQGQISKKLIKVNLQLLVSQQTIENAFQTLKDMNIPRYAHCSIELDNKIYVIGGRQYAGNESSILKNCQSYDIKTNKWVQISNLNQPRSQSNCLIYNKKIYLFNGCTNYTTRTRHIQTFSPQSNKWIILPYLMPQGLQNPAIIKHKDNQSVYIFGGKTDYNKSNRVLEYDLNKQTILVHLDMEIERCYHKIAQNADQVYIIGGGTQTIEVYNTKDSHTQINYDINYLQFISTKQMNSFSQFKSSIYINQRKKKYESPNYKNKVFIFGHSHQPFTKILDCDKFIVTNDAQSLFHSFYQFTTTIKVNKQHAFIMGGINSDFTQVTDTVYSFSLLTEQIKYLNKMKTARYGFSAIVKGSYLYVIGGRKIGTDDVAILNQCERFSFQKYQWQSISPLKTKRHSSSAILAGDYIVVIGGYKGNGARISDVQIYIQHENRWVQLDDKFDLAVQAMTPIIYQQNIYLFGGRNQTNDIQKVFKLKIQIDDAVKYQRMVNLSLQPVGSLSAPGTNLKVFLNPINGLCYVFGNIQNGFDVYDLKKHKVVQKEQLVVFQKLKDKKFQSYTLVF